VHVVNVPAGGVQKALRAYRANPNVEFAEPDYYRVLVLPDEGNDLSDCILLQRQVMQPSGAL
jgi:hypothetical protein